MAGYPASRGSRLSLRTLQRNPSSSASVAQPSAPARRLGRHPRKPPQLSRLVVRSDVRLERSAACGGNRGFGEGGCRGFRAQGFGRKHPDSHCKYDATAGYSCKTRTKDLRYESKDSREMLKGSVSPKKARWLDEVELRDLVLPQKAFFSGGDGWKWPCQSACSYRGLPDSGLQCGGGSCARTGRKTPLSLISAIDQPLFVGAPGTGRNQRQDVPLSLYSVGSLMSTGLEPTVFAR